MIEQNINETIETVIKSKNKSFVFKDVYTLIERNIKEYYNYKCKTFLMTTLMVIMVTTLLGSVVNSDIGDYDDCMAFGV